MAAQPEEIKSVNRVGGNEFTVQEKVGRYYSSDELIKIAEKERIFIDKSGGGVTFSGGEPLLQHEFLEEALRSFRGEGIHTAVDTSGFASPDVIAKIIPLTSLFLFDLKHLDAMKHIEYTGVSNELIINNLGLILDSGKEVMLRIPVIPGINDLPDHLAALRELISRKSSSLKMVNLLPYHKTGTSKYLKFNRLNRMEGVRPPDHEYMKHLKEFFSTTGVKIKIGG